MKKLKALLTILGTALIVLTAGLTLRAREEQFKQPLGGRPLPVWVAQLEHASIQSPKGAFEVQAALITPKNILLFYTMQPSIQGKARVAAHSAPGGGQSKMLTAAVQPLRRLAGFDLGVIRIPWSDQPQQSITLSITPPENGERITQPWELTPLKQFAPSDGRPHFQFLSFQRKLSPIEVRLGSLGGNGDIADLKVSVLGQGGETAYFRVDAQENIVQVTEEEYRNLVKPVVEPTDTTDSDPGYAPTPAPLEN